MIPFLFMFYFGIHKVLGISWLLEDLLASQEGLCPMELVTYFMSLYVCAVFIKLMDDLETLGCILRVAHPKKKAVLAHWIDSPKSHTSQCFWMRLAVWMTNTAMLLSHLWWLSNLSTSSGSCWDKWDGGWSASAGRTWLVIGRRSLLVV